MNLEPVIVQYEICPFGADDFEGISFTIYVERWEDGWAITRTGAYLSSVGEWTRSGREETDSEQWRHTHVFPLDEAIRRAQEALPKLRINGHTAADLLAETS